MDGRRHVLRAGWAWYSCGRMRDLSCYHTTPRSRELAPNIYRNRNRAIVWLVGALLAGFVIGAFMSLFRRRGSLPWEPKHALVGGAIWVVILGALALVVLIMLQRYVWLFKRGVAAEGVVIATGDGPPGGKCWVRVEDGDRGAFFTLLLDESHAPGTAIVAIHSPGTKLVLLASAPGVMRRGSKCRIEDLPPEVAALAAR